MVFFALLPSLSAGFFGAGGWAWRAPQLLFGAYQASLMALFFASIRPGEINGLERILTVLGVAVISLQLLTGFGYLNEYLEEAYYLALLWLLLVAAFDFAAIILRRGPV